MAITKTIANLITQAGNDIPDNIIQSVSPQDVREVVQNIAQSGYNKITDVPIVGLKEYSTVPAYEYKQACLNSGDIYISNKVTTPGAFNVADWDLYGSAVLADINRNNYFFVDPINGNDGTGVKGMRSSSYATIAGAEAIAVSGDIIYIASNITEANCGKDGLTYVYGLGVIHTYPDTDANIAGEDWNALYSDFNKGVISIKIIGGNLEFGSYWVGTWKRGIVRLLQASTVEIKDAESLRGDYRANDGNMFHLVGDNSSVDVSCSGNIEFPWRVLYVSGDNCTANVTASKSIMTQNSSGTAILNSVGASALVNVSAGISIIIGGHPLGGARGILELSGPSGALSLPKTKISLTTPLINFYDKNPITTEDERGLVYMKTNANAHVSINADTVKVDHIADVALPGARFAGRMAVVGASQTTVDFEAVIDYNVRLTLLGIDHNFDYNRLMNATSLAVSKDNITVNLTDSTVVSYTDSATAYTDWKDVTTVDNLSLFNPKYINYVFNGTTKVIINPVAITAGKLAIGDNTNDSAYIVGEFISNATIKNTSFVDDYTGVDQATGIPKMKLLVSNRIADYTKYEGLL